MKNFEVKEAIENANLYQWQVANALNISEFTLSRRLRNELTSKEKEKILNAIEKLKKNEFKEGWGWQKDSKKL